MLNFYILTLPLPVAYVVRSEPLVFNELPEIPWNSC
jgi:hypothetical protein